MNEVKFVAIVKTGRQITENEFTPHTVCKLISEKTTVSEIILWAKKIDDRTVNITISNLE